MLATAVVVAGLGVALGVVLSSGSSGGGSGQNVALQPVAAAGQDPFTGSVAYAAGSGQGGSSGSSGSPSGGNGTASGAASPPAAGGTVDGGTPGLYGGTREVASCDVPKLSGYLTENADKGRAWAGVEGIDNSQIDGYLHGLTPVVLRQDTRVTNHGYHDGQATAYQAVLQSGTAVLVDNQGVPRVRCACGNPLLPPNGSGGTYTGTGWTSFQANGVVTVKPAAAPVTQIVLVDQATGSQFDRPVGGTGGSDSSAKPSASGSASSPGKSGGGSPSGKSPAGPSTGPSAGSPSSGASGPSGKSSPGSGPGSAPASSPPSTAPSGHGSSGAAGSGSVG
ncbi:DUF6777 domain-containing protein [Kitasatospora cheerisanensis]|uniref:DUF6777 domain-containing protein n=1 Tax=Kitasatospora cheerisanensis TaxID=81942 RepID=UPI0012EEAE07|nr:DUF6777 domain-containing protein [Kitasatospora cheerisanensis]